MKEYQFLYFVERDSKPKTKVFEVRNKMFNTFLGEIKWYAPWRKYCYFSPQSEFVYDAGCLADIADFLNDLMAERRQK